jgi:hypothetical protein
VRAALLPQPGERRVSDGGVEHTREKLAEVLGLAQAAQDATQKVERLVDDDDVKAAELVDWALPIQERHFSDVRECSLKLAGEEDPNA